ncbi:MAG: hypothetical protein Q7T50_00830 [Candidatus Magasanikbacteria bacterium]|nr:hypothetical protein [Candidatus Magasanikbacteria bacterium]
MSTPNPTIRKKESSFLVPTDNAKQLFKVIYQDESKKAETGDEVPKINVSSVISKMSFYYEKIRNSVDYEEEHLHRKNAIKRIVKRLIVIEGKIVIKELKTADIAKHLMVELIRAGYLPNNKIPETKIDEVEKIIDKYLKLKDFSLEGLKITLNDKNDLVDWIMAMTASEIEEKLGRSRVDMAVVSYMDQVLTDRIAFPDDSPYSADKDIQVILGIYRNFLKFDDEMLSFLLLKHYYPNWTNPSEGDIEEVAKGIFHLQENIQAQINHPFVAQFNRIINRYTVFFSVLIEVIKEDPVKVYESFQNDPTAFSRKIKAACNQKYKVAGKKKWRVSVRSIVYIFITKSVFAFALEVPATKWLGEELNLFSLLVNIAFPPALLFLIVLFTMIPGSDNTNKIVEGIEDIVFDGDKKKEPFKLRKPAKRNKTLGTVFGLIYAFTFCISFGLVVWVLDKLNFSWLSIIIFIFFLALISFFSIKVRKTARELLIVEKKESLLSFLIDFFYVPIIEVGRWLSERFSKINVFVFILDFIIEAPFKIFVEIAEEWTRYVKERKDDIT